MMHGMIAQEGTVIANRPLPTFPADVLFQSSFKGTAGGTDAFDASPFHATMTFSGAILSAAQSTLDLGVSLKSAALTDFVSVPRNAAYETIGLGDFTIETFIYVPTFSFSIVDHFAGVWAPDTAQFCWRYCIDSIRMYFQYRRSGTDFQFSVPHGLLTNTWYHLAACRSLNTLRFFRQGEMIMTKEFPPVAFDTPALVTPLYIAGAGGKTGSNAFYQSMRITRGAWYRSDSGFPVPTQDFGHGYLFPSLVPAGDIFYTPSVV